MMDNLTRIEEEIKRFPASQTMMPGHLSQILIMLLDQQRRSEVEFQQFQHEFQRHGHRSSPRWVETGLPMRSHISQESKPASPEETTPWPQALKTLMESPSTGAPTNSVPQPGLESVVQEIQQLLLQASKMLERFSFTSPGVPGTGRSASIDSCDHPTNKRWNFAGSQYQWCHGCGCVLYPDGQILRPDPSPVAEQREEGK